MNFNALLDTKELQASAHRRVLDGFVAANIFDF
jgi:hypothetical protein